MISVHIHAQNKDNKTPNSPVTHFVDPPPPPQPPLPPPPPPPPDIKDNDPDSEDVIPPSIHSLPVPPLPVVNKTGFELSVEKINENVFVVGEEKGYPKNKND